MKAKIFKKGISWILAAMMIVATVFTENAITASAAQDDVTVTVHVTNNTQMQNPGTLYYRYRVSGQFVSWQAVAIDTSGDGVIKLDSSTSEDISFAIQVADGIEAMQVKYDDFNLTRSKYEISANPDNDTFGDTKFGTITAGDHTLNLTYQPKATSYHVTFGSGQIISPSPEVPPNQVNYVVNNTIASIKLIGFTISNGEVNLPDNAFISLVGFDPDTMEVKLSTPDGMNTTLSVANNGFSLSDHPSGVNLPTNTPLTLEIVPKNGSNPPPPPQGGDTDVKFTITKFENGEPSFDEFVNIVIGNSGLITSAPEIKQEALANNNTFTLANAINSQNPPQKITLFPDFGSAWDSIKINGQDVEIQIDEFGEQFVEIILPAQLPPTLIYDVEIIAGEAEDITMVWAYSKTSKYYINEETLVEHGKVEVVSISRDNGSGKQVLYEAGDEMKEVDVSKEGGRVELKKGDDMIVKIIPDYGYQLKSVNINDDELIPQAGVSTFELQNIQGNLHFSGAFVKAEDKIACDDSKTVKKASIANGENAATSGNLSLTVEDNSKYNKDVTSVVTGEATKVASLDLTLDNVVSKGDGKNYWTSNITEFAKPIEVSLSLDGSALAENETYTVVRDHNGKLTEIEATYDAKTNSISFGTNQFSTYTLVKVIKKAEETPTTEEPTTEAPKKEADKPASPKTGDMFVSIAWILMLLTLLEIIAVGTLKKVQK